MTVSKTKSYRSTLGYYNCVKIYYHYEYDDNPPDGTLGNKIRYPLNDLYKLVSFVSHFNEILIIHPNTPRLTFSLTTLSRTDEILV